MDPTMKSINTRINLKMKFFYLLHMLEYKQYQQVNLNTEELHTLLASAVVELSDLCCAAKPLSKYRNAEVNTGGVHETSVSTSVKTTPTSTNSNH